MRQNVGKTYTGRHGVFRSIALDCFGKVLKQIAGSDFSIAGIGEDELNQQAVFFMDTIDQAFILAEQNITQRDRNPLFWAMRDAFITKEIKGLSKEIQFSFQAFLVRQRFGKETEVRQKQLLDFRYPQEWFPATRIMQRTIHVHVGPTNSGKTYNAIKALENSRRGVYSGPLRLLATEIYQRLTAKGLPCALVTGEEIRVPEGTDNYFTSCTVEMTPLNVPFDVAVIDEIQMMADPERGSAWTAALLGVQAKEVHVCGEDRTVKLIQALCAGTGDKCIIHRYERLSPLKTMKTAIGSDFEGLKKGDAIVAFSRLSLHVLKRKVETRTGRRCAIVYGSLPPEVRVQQAALFNSPDNDYDYIVASDAIGMGLNLEIRRVILESVTKYDGSQHRHLTFPEIKQIGGRAGRYRAARSAVEGLPEADKDGEKENVGYVTTVDQADLRSVQRAFRNVVPDLEFAVIHPPPGILERYASYYPPQTPLSYIFMRIKMTATIAPGFRLHVPSDSMEIADILQDIPLEIGDRITLCYMPANLRMNGAVPILRALANVISQNLPGDLLSLSEIPLEILDQEPEDVGKSPQDHLYQLESLHVSLNQYLWLSYRYTTLFRDRDLAFHVRSLVEAKLVDSLERMDFTETRLQVGRGMRRRLAGSHNYKGAIAELGEDAEDHIDEPDDPPMDDGPLSQGEQDASPRHDVPLDPNDHEREARVEAAPPKDP